MKKSISGSIIIAFLTAILFVPGATLAVQRGQHNGDKLDVTIEYQNFFGTADFPSLNLFGLPIYYIGGTMDYTVEIVNNKKSTYNHLVVLVLHREYPSGNIIPGYEIDAFSGLPYHNRVYIDTLKQGETLDLSFSIPVSASAGADQTEVIIYRGYNLDDTSGVNEWSSGRIIFEETVGYFCPPEVI
ncbi:MAG: hypothetical protein A3F15_02605 [Candidatus Wildermuthbacteria bacterium RIFCSPHIGHO2_12_FULL_40_12]|uniref:Uncharacterized protein n=1 Tax=Candidatus Wildermuthbacteria bacterium RIFCSPHIGHO2_12_FULL_40_12 TaxID=1802457 RepID=A0A1G2RDY3_9BACT|nr:MAG: hypothetical protein A3F15_02605 [Candidatus Wildermuthbacteria bacterium RIFCSPHIGHO2_12_FULL_40_12]